MAPLHRGHNLYAARQKAHSAAWKALSKAEKARYGSYNKFRTSSEGRSINKRVHEEWSAGEGPNAKKGRDTDAGAANESDPANDNDPDTPDSERREIADFLERVELPSDFGDLFDIGDFDMADIQNNAALPMETGASTSVAQNSDGESRGMGGVGASSQGAGAGISGAAGLTFVSPVNNSESGIYTYQKKFFKYTYGLAHTMINSGGIGRYITPYAYIPVDWLPFYLTPAEYQAIPMNSKVVGVNCKITLMGTRTAFDHGTTLSGTATTEYVPICKYAIGLNTRVFIENNSVTLKSAEPMTVESVARPKLNEQMQKLYDDYPPATEVPRHHNWYGCYTYNTQKVNGSAADTRSEYGLYRMDHVLKTAMVNKVLGTPLINYSYRPRTGMIKPGKLPMTMNYSDPDGKFPAGVSSTVIPYAHNVPHFAEITTEKGNVRMNGALASIDRNYATRVEGNYQQQLEQYIHIDPQTGTASSNFSVQPQVHIGLLATPALNPATETAQYLNSCLYYLIETSIQIKHNVSSMCTFGVPRSWPQEHRFYMDTAHKYNGYGYQNFGLTATLDGNVEATTRFNVEAINPELQRLSTGTGPNNENVGKRKTSVHKKLGRSSKERMLTAPLSTRLSKGFQSQQSSSHVSASDDDDDSTDLFEDIEFLPPRTPKPKGGSK
uniref:VP4 n=1 Tax=Dendrocopos leucotos parvoviridae sp. TaxID=2794475 RepID=A0A8E7L5L0_9VIRU|nr:MAG: VP4 [Dendrocopos leucotos parvoviridae sp.]